MKVNKNPFSIEVNMIKSLFYSPHLSPIMVPKEYKQGLLESCILTNKIFQFKNPIDLCTFHLLKKNSLLILIFFFENFFEKNILHSIQILFCNQDGDCWILLKISMLKKSHIT